MNTRLGVILSTLGATAVALATSAITFSGGVVEYTAADQTMVSTGIGNSLQSFWAAVGFILPYLGGIAALAFVAFLILRVVRGVASR